MLTTSQCVGRVSRIDKIFISWCRIFLEHEIVPRPSDLTTRGAQARKRDALNLFLGVAAEHEYDAAAEHEYDAAAEHECRTHPRRWTGCAARCSRGRAPSRPVTVMMRTSGWEKQTIRGCQGGVATLASAVRKFLNAIRRSWNSDAIATTYPGIEGAGLHSAACRTEVERPKRSEYCARNVVLGMTSSPAKRDRLRSKTRSITWLLRSVDVSFNARAESSAWGAGAALEPGRCRPRPQADRDPA
jgi:hypothetical protein